MRRKTSRLALVTEPPATAPSEGAAGTVAVRTLGATLLGLGAALLGYIVFARHGERISEKLKQWIPKITITRESEVILTDVHRNGHSKARLGGLGRL